MQEWTAGNTEKQNSHRLQSFDIAPIREQLQLRVEDCYQNLMKRAIEPILSPKIGKRLHTFFKFGSLMEATLAVPGILQHETASDVHGASIGNVRQLARDNSRETTKRGLDDLCDFVSALICPAPILALIFWFQLNFVHAKLTVYGADQVLLGQVFGQIASWICALSLNHLMFRKELCNFEKAVQIK